MKTIGLIGGMSWESTALYYRLINQGIKKKLGGLHSARIALVSVDFHEIELLQHADQWAEAGKVLAQAGQQVEAAGADFLLICTNTMHRVAEQVESAIRIPLLHLADATARNICQQGHQTVGLLGTRFTMAQDFYKRRLSNDHGLNVIVPSTEDQEIIHRVIYEELCMGIVKESSRQEYIRVIDQMHQTGAQAVIQGCTEIGMLVEQKHSQVPLFDTTLIHAQDAVEQALSA